MYVGSKDYVLSLDLHDINREPLIVSCRRRVAGGGWKGDNRAPGGYFRCRGKSLMGIAGAGGEEVEPGGSPGLPWAGVSTDPLACLPAEDRGVHLVRQEQQREWPPRTHVWQWWWWGWWPALEGDPCPQVLPWKSHPPGPL